MDLHAQIMNLPCDMPDCKSTPARLYVSGYQDGHKDARHAAAELASKANAERAELLDALKKIAGFYDHDTACGELATRLYTARDIALVAIAKATGQEPAQ